MFIEAKVERLFRWCNGERHEIFVDVIVLMIRRGSPGTADSDFGILYRYNQQLRDFQY
jgi:hypothetical protein